MSQETELRVLRTELEGLNARLLALSQDWAAVARDDRNLHSLLADYATYNERWNAFIERCAAAGVLDAGAP